MTSHETVLVCEDNDEDFDTVTTAAGQLGVAAQLQRAMDGEACLKLLRGVGASRRPQLVLLDLNMPGMDGRETLQELRADPWLREVPVVVLTSSSSPQDVDFCYRTGAAAYHTKPVRYLDHLQTLLNLLGYWLGPVVLPGHAKGS